jgi:hypothetical protein
MASNDLGYTLTDLVFNSVELQRDDLTVHLEVVRGLDENPNSRGQDTVVPHLEGQVSRTYRDDILEIELFGFVQGSGSTEALRRASFRTLAEEMKFLFRTNNEANLAGVDAGAHTYEIAAKPVVGGALRWGPQDIPGFRPLTVLLVATTAYWVIDGGGS